MRKITIHNLSELSLNDVFSCLEDKFYNEINIVYADENVYLLPRNNNIKYI